MKILHFLITLFLLTQFSWAQSPGLNLQVFDPDAGQFSPVTSTTSVDFGVQAIQSIPICKLTFRISNSTGITLSNPNVTVDHLPTSPADSPPLDDEFDVSEMESVLASGSFEDFCVQFSPNLLGEYSARISISYTQGFGVQFRVVGESTGIPSLTARQSANPNISGSPEIGAVPKLQVRPAQCFLAFVPPNYL